MIFEEYNLCKKNKKIKNKDNDSFNLKFLFQSEYIKKIRLASIVNDNEYIFNFNLFIV